MNKLSDSTTLPPLIHTFSAEMRLLICCARVEMVEPFQGHLGTLIQKGIKWDSLLPLAVRHGMVALLHRHLMETNGTAIPIDFSKSLKISDRSTRARQLFLTARMLKISQMLTDAGIPHLHYKGIVLDHLIYGGKMLRSTGDMDILVRIEDVMRIKQLVMSEGYIPDLIDHEHQEAVAIKTAKDYVFIHPETKHVIEVHWALTKSDFGGRFDFAHFEPSKQAVHINGFPLWTFGPADLYLALASHGARHQFESLKWLIDLEQFGIHFPDIDSLKLACKAKAENTVTMYMLSLDLRRRLMGSSAQDVEASVAKMRRIQALSLEVCRVIEEGRPARPLFEHHSFHVKLIDGMMAKLRFIFTLSTRPNVKDVKRRKLPWYLAPYYYVARVGRLVQQRGFGPLAKALAQMVRGLRT